MGGELWTLLSLAGVLLLGVVSPGPNFVLVTSTAMQLSRRAGLATAAGLGLGSLTWVALTEAGFALLIAPGSVAAEAVRLLGAAYLIVVGVKMVLGARKPLAAAADTGARGLGPALRKGYFASLANPKALAFYASIFAAMVPARASLWFGGAVLLVTFLVSASWYGTLALAFSSPRVRAGFARVKAGAETAMGLCLVGLGGRLLLAR